MIQLQITDELLLEMGGSPEERILYAMEGDTAARKIRITLLDKGESWPLPQGVSPALAFRKADRHQGLYDRLPDGTGALTLEETAVTVALAPQVLSFPGDVKAAVVFRDQSLNQLSSFPFTIRVLPNPAAGQRVSNDYYNYTTLAEVNEAVDAALASLEEAEQDFLAKAEGALQVVHDTATEDAPAIVCQASGEVIAISDAANRPLAGLNIYGKTTQNGTPAPDTPVPLEGIGEAVTVTVAGKNLFNDVAWFEILGFTKQSDGSWLGGLVNTPCYTNTAKVKGSMYVTAIAKTASTLTPMALRAIYTDGTEDRLFNVTPTNGFVTFTAVTNPEKTVDYIKWTWGSGGEYYVKGVSISFVNNEYEPYKETQTLTAATQGGLHGIGEVKDEIDFARGVRITRIAELDLSAKGYDYADNVFVASLGNMAQDSAGFCSHYLAVKSNFQHMPDKSINFNDRAMSSRTIICIRDDRFTSTAELKAWLVQQKENGTSVTVKYALAEPIETPLSAEEIAEFAALRSNKPNTTVFNDGGAEMKLSYVADTKTYIDQKISAISAAMLGN